MRTIETILYKFEELSEEAKENAFNDFVNDSDREYFWMDEAMETIKKGLEFFGFKLVDWDIDYYCATSGYTSIQYQNSNGYMDEDDTLEYVRLWKFLNNNFMRIKPAYGPEIVNTLDGNCPLTGVCFDESFLDPIRKFMEQPENITFRELMEECIYEVLKDMENDYEYQNSLEFFEEECKANEYKFTEDGTQY